MGKLANWCGRTRVKAAGGAGGLLDMLASVSKSRTAEIVADKKQQLEQESVSVDQ